MGVYVFIKGFGAHDFGRGAAISLLMLAMTAFLSIFYVRQMVRAGDVE
jgi:N,N'-diacetylchitobiose transport system permease protein